MNPQPSPFAQLVLSIVVYNSSAEDVAQSAFDSLEPTKSELRVTEAALKDLYSRGLLARDVKRTYTRTTPPAAGAASEG